MKIKEILTESGTGSLIDGVKHTLGRTYVLPNLTNSDFYLQYRMGVALAAAQSDYNTKFDSASTFGENMVISNYTPAEEEIMKLALKLMGNPLGKAKQVSTDSSEEATDTNKVSPMLPKGPIKRNETV